MLTLFTANDIITSQGKYPARAKHPACTKEVVDNADDLTDRLNGLFEDYLKACISSGFRTPESNAETPGAAAGSHHMRANASDIQTLGYFLKADYLKNKEKSLLVKHDLYLEDPEYTKGWTHLQRVPPKSGKRIFIP